MPYVTRICSACEKKQTCYHNVWKCRKCGAARSLVTSERHEHRTASTVRHENRILRSEVNALRSRLGLDIKYREWEGGQET